MEEKVDVEKGKIVHFVLENGDHRPAIVTDRIQGGWCNLVIFVQYDDGMGINPVVFKPTIPHCEEPKPNTWHFTERI